MDLKVLSLKTKYHLQTKIIDFLTNYHKSTKVKHFKQTGKQQSSFYHNYNIL